MNLKDQIEEAGLSACIQLLGYHTDLEKYVNASDLVVSASKRGPATKHYGSNALWKSSSCI